MAIDHPRLVFLDLGHEVLKSTMLAMLVEASEQRPPAPLGGGK
jgi:hypothetical protein